MISVDLSTLVFLYIIGLGGTIMLFWFVLEKFIDRPVQTVHEVKSVLRCELCMHEFVDNSPQRYVNCPVCSTLLDRENAFISEFAESKDSESDSE